MKQIQKDCDEWNKKNFPNREDWWFILGAQEELGELAHAHLKGVEGIRHDPDKIDALKKDAVADCVIFLMQYCSQNDWVLEDLVREAWDHVSKRDWRKNPVTG